MISNTNLDDVIAKIEEHIGVAFKENEVVHTFGSTATLLVNGLNVPHIEPSEITDDRRIKVVLFKENLSTGWDCPRAETMMSFRHAEDATYIAQLLGRMVRTPLQSHILVASASISVFSGTEITGSGSLCGYGCCNGNKLSFSVPCSTRTRLRKIFLI